MMYTAEIKMATVSDIAVLVPLVNSAYRGEESRKGWTTEADLLDGTIRIDENSLSEMLQKPGAVMLTWRSDAGIIQGCMYLQPQDNHRLYLGMLSVLPGIQNRGIGKLFLTAAETYAVQSGCHLIYMEVISVRHELIAWYKRHGYTVTGETKPFPAETKFGIPLRTLEFAILEKKIT